MGIKMKNLKLSFAALLFLPSLAVSADWRPLDSAVGQTDRIDAATIRKVGKYVTAWIMTDYKEARTLQSKSYRSVKALSYYDCESRRWDMVHVTMYEGEGGTGAIVFSNSTELDEKKMKYVVPETVAEGNMEVACNIAKLKKL